MNLQHFDKEKLFEKVFLEGPLGIAVVGLDYKFLEINQAFAEMVGYSVEELRGKSFVDITHPEDIAVDTQLAEQLFQGVRKNYQIEKRYIKKNGEVLPICLFGSLIRDDAGNPIYGLAMVISLLDFFRSNAHNLLAKELLVKVDPSKPGLDRNKMAKCCSWCQKIQTADGTWKHFTTFLERLSGIALTHTICEACFKEQKDKTR